MRTTFKTNGYITFKQLAPGHCFRYVTQTDATVWMKIKAPLVSNGKINVVAIHDGCGAYEPCDDINVIPLDVEAIIHGNG